MSKKFVTVADLDVLLAHPDCDFIESPARRWPLPMVEELEGALAKPDGYYVKQTKRDGSLTAVPWFMARGLLFGLSVAAILAMLLVFGVLLSTRAHAQNNPALSQVRQYSVFTPLGRAPDSSVTTTTSRVVLGVAGPVAWICNTGTNDAYAKLGDVSVVATLVADTLVRAGSCMELDAGGATNLASITAASTTTLVVSVGQGSPSAAGGGSSGGGGGGAVTIANGADVAEGSTTDAACGTDNGTCTVGAVLKRIAQRITSLITALGSPFQAGGSIGNTTFAATQGTAANLNATVVGTGTFVVQAAATATEVHVGEVGGNIIPITNAMTTTNATITTGQSIGGIQTLANAVRVSGALGASGTSGIIQSLTVTFTDAVGAGPLDVYFYNATVTTGSNCQNATAFVLQNGDRDKVLGIAHVTDFTASNTAAVAQANNLAIPFGLASSTSLFACVVGRASFAITGTANASLKVNVLRN